MAANEEAESIRTKKLTRKTVFFGGGWKARGLHKGGFGCGLAIKAKKGEKKVQAVRVGLRLWFLSTDSGYYEYTNHTAKFFYHELTSSCIRVTKKRFLSTFRLIYITK